MRTALRVGWRVGVGRGGAAVGADQRKQGAGICRGGLAPLRARQAAASVRAPEPVALRVRRPRGSLRLRPAMASRRLGRAVRAGSRRLVSPPSGRGPGRAGQGRAPPPLRPRRVARSDASAPIRQAPRRSAASGPDGPGAWGAADRRPAPTGASGGRRPPQERFARRFPTPRRRQTRPADASSEAACEEASGPVLRRFRMRLGQVPNHVR